MAVERQPGHWGKGERVKNRNVNAFVTQGDMEMLEAIAERLHASKSEAVRTAIRLYYAILIQGDKR